MKGSEKTVVSERVTTGLRNGPFVIKVANGWNKLLEKLIEVGSVREFRGKTNFAGVRRRRYVNFVVDENGREECIS